MQPRRRAPASALLAEVRALYQRSRETGGPTYYDIAESANLNRQSVQRLLACTRVQRPTVGHMLGLVEAVVAALGYEVVLRPKEVARG